VPARLRAALLALCALSIVGAMSLPALAQPSTAPAPTEGHSLLAQGGEGVRGTVRDGEGEPVPGVEITVADADGNVIETAVTDDEGAWAVDVPEAGRLPRHPGPGHLPGGRRAPRPRTGHPGVRDPPRPAADPHLRHGRGRGPRRLRRPFHDPDAERSAVRAHHRHHGDRALADLRDHRARQLRPRRARDARCGARLVPQRPEPARARAAADRRRRDRHGAVHGGRRRRSSSDCGDRCADAGPA
jgi:hypothetical protein